MEGAKQLGVQLSESQSSQLLCYLELLNKWNKAYNLTAVRNPEEMLYRHLLDSLSVVSWVKGERIIDVGTGPGLPGIPLAILFPETDFTLLDSNGKKTRFLTQCKLEMELDNITVIHGRVEEFQPEQPFDQVISRAFSAIENMVNWCGHLVNSKSKFLAMKGLFPEEELTSLPEGYTVDESHALDVPGCDGERHLIIIRKNG
ncbi:16S rRNA (guanine(527)-N(7))-methyltransferase RsmG [Alkalimarinus sediminis]|uniref:Ribosomal RNA small subunit methyltransferase G n=1 Tax=Alkalimarinus sediminis TaxID=1632866 RepID=A0A9E8HLP1_9ALTE|nr:16S rRNA (guanine(527)-N(7))-methyltransferase RsmG [Alkalimarinus sediminis]UZW76890.1 16S rRNA (guanine(527)-N(7))-methyltransferase RsmG [Alkalimarinus sediminis]